ncbi:MAG: hypothetical protein KJO11_09450 [Gemmatimonadetes bacterium]|nr:hypothetical protein [Gemmatimonadota bacterium]
MVTVPVHEASLGPTFRWGWMTIGIVVGSLLIATFVGVVWNEQPRPAIALLVGGLTFVLAGIFVGFNSPGKTVVEPGIAGAVIGLAAATILAALGTFPVTVGTFFQWILAGGVLAALGGWVGELMQGTIAGGEARGRIQWPWVVVGVVLGFVFNIYFVFVGRALFDLGALGLLGSFALSFLITGFFVGFFSPGVTLAEPAVAGLLLVIIDSGVTTFGFGAPMPMGTVLLGLVGAFFLALLGGWLGELVQEDTAPA